MGDLTLAEFLAARLNEDEAGSREIHEARVCSGCSDGWEAGFDPDRCDCGYPARVLREAEAGRKILAQIVPELERWKGFVESEYNSYPDYDHLDLLKIMAAVYSDHPDYCEEWKL